LIEQSVGKKQHSEFAKYSLYNYIGVLIGVFSNLFIYTNNQEFLGVLRYTESLSYLVWPIMLMGGSSSLINFTPKLKGASNTKLFSYALLTILRNSIFIFVILFLGMEFFGSYIKLEFIYFAVFLALFLAGIDLLKKQLTIHKKIAFPTVLDNLIPKLVLPLIFISYYYNFIEGDIVGLTLYICAYFIIILALFLYGSKLNVFLFTLRIKPLFTIISKKEYFNYSFFALAGSLGYLFVFKLDALMIPNLISYKANGVYSIATVAASVIFIPARGMFSLYAPQISTLVKTERFQELNTLYKDVARSLLFLGLLIYSAIFLGIEYLFQIMPSKEVLLQTVLVIYIIGATSVFNMATGFNSEIINYSKHYKFNIIALGILTLLNLVSNYVFIVTYNWGIEGAALASFLSIVIYNLLKVGFIYKHMSLLPFDRTFFKLLFVQFTFILVFYLLPNFSNPFLNVVFKVGGVLFSQLFLIYKFNWVQTYTSFLDKYIFRTTI
jgi:O-antigen/teichoic acid export membrane protein